MGSSKDKEGFLVFSNQCMQALCAVVHSVGRKTVLGEKKYLLFPDYFIRTSLWLSLLHVGKDLGRKEKRAKVRHSPKYNFGKCGAI